jgi:voltage-gated potassium channel
MLKGFRAATDTLAELALVYLALILLATLLFMAIEAQPFLDSLYWAGTTATSTGYGDISAKSWAGRMLSLALMHLSIFGIAPLIVVRLVDRLNENRDAFTHEEQLALMARLDRIEALLAARGETTRPVAADADDRPGRP